MIQEIEFRLERSFDREEMANLVRDALNPPVRYVERKPFDFADVTSEWELHAHDGPRIEDKS